MRLSRLRDISCRLLSLDSLVSYRRKSFDGARNPTRDSYSWLRRTFDHRHNAQPFFE